MFTLLDGLMVAIAAVLALALLNALAQRAREMASGHRHDTINEFLDALNELRTTTLRESILR